MPEKIIIGSYGTELGKNYLDYAMYVAKERALPDAKDGLKPVQRRILFDMHELGLSYNKPFKKSARVVGDTLGKYHPHGDTSVYEAMVILSQDFKMRYPLVEGHGNFGSVDGDSAAAMRYTEARLSRLGQYMIKDINKNTVDFKPNYDGEEQEPIVMPSLFPNLLVNGVSGIAVGLATSMPPHNLKDVYNCLYHIIDKKLIGEEADINDLIKIIGAPDFPTGGQIIGLNDVIRGYKTGKGKVVLRGTHHIEETKNGTSIIITEIPYKTNKTTLINLVASDTKDVKNSKGVVIQKANFSQVKEIRDETNKEGMRIVIELKKDESPELVLNNLIKQEIGFQKSIGMNTVALVGKIPKELTLKDLLDEFLIHSADVILRRTQFDLDKSIKRLNFVEAILKLFNGNIMDLVIEAVRNSEDPEAELVKLDFNAEQAKYICDMKLRSLSKLSHNAFENEKLNIEATIGQLTLVLEDPVTLMATIKAEFEECEKIFGDERKTTISLDTSTIEDEDLVEDETLIVTYSTDGIIKAVEEGVYNTQRRGGRGVVGASTKDEEAIKFMFTSHSKDDLLFFTNTGRCYILKAYKIGKSTKAGKGKSLNNYLTLEPGEKILNILNTNVKDNPDGSLLMITRFGTLKKLNLKELSSKFSYTKVINFKEGDSLIQAQLINKENVMIVTKLGQSLRLDTGLEGTKAINPLGRTAMGVKGIGLKENDEVISMCIVSNEDSLLTISETGLGKRTKMTEWNCIGRGAKGIVAHKLSDRTGNLICAITAKEDEELFIATEQGLIQRIKISQISEFGRATSGVKVMNLGENDKIVSVSTCKVVEEEIQE